MSKDNIGNQLENLANEVQDKLVSSQLQSFADKAKINSKIEDKRKKYEEQGHADKEFEKTVNGRFVKIWLPASVFVQQTLLSIAAKVMTNDFQDIDECSKLTERYYKAVCSHLQIDAKNVNADSMDLADLQAYALLYWVELLAPLSAWGDVKSKNTILN